MCRGVEAGSAFVAWEVVCLDGSLGLSSCPKRDNERGGGQQGSGACDARPACDLPGRAREQRAEGAAEEVAAHEDRVDAVRGRGAEFEKRGLVAQLDALHADVEQQDAGDDRQVVVRAEEEHSPGGQLHQGTEAVEAEDAQPCDVFPGDGGRQGPGDAAQTEQPDDVAAGVEGCLRHLEGERCPEAEERPEGEGGAQGV